MASLVATAQTGDAQLEDLRSKLDGLLRDADAYGKIREALDDAGAKENRGQGLQKDALLRRLMAAAERSPAPELLGGSDSTRGAPAGDVLALRIDVKGGAAFVAELAETDGVSRAVRAHLAFDRQRASTRLAAARVDPELRGCFFFEIARPAPKTPGAWRKLIQGRASSLRIAVTRERVGNALSHKRELVATASLDWRKALLDRGGARSIALKAAGPDGVDGEVATLDVALDVVAVGGALDLPFQPDDVEDAMRKARSEHAEAARAFYLYAKQWWDGFAKGAGRDLQQREVKLFARDEAGEMRCVCSYVHPLRANRVLDGPHQAARFVSLLPLEKAGSVAGGNADTWHTPLATCARGSGDVWDHATLLCSLLRGYGLDARVCVGSMSDGRGGAQPHVWVATFLRTSVDASGRARLRVTAWESATGRRCSLAPLDAQARERYLSVACVFGDDSFHANKQPSDAILRCSWDLEDANAWLALDPRRLAALENNAAKGAMADFGLAPPLRDPRAMELEMERDLKALIERHREASRGLSTHWDADLGYMLQPSLAAYEQERVTGHAVDHADFQDAVRRRVPRGHCFKGFPTCFPHAHAGRALAALERGDLSRDVLDTQGEQVTHALRVRVFPYAENVCAVWVMLAVHYKKAT